MYKSSNCLTIILMLSSTADEFPDGMTDVKFDENRMYTLKGSDKFCTTEIQ